MCVMVAGNIYGKGDREDGAPSGSPTLAAQPFVGEYFRGEGDVHYLQLLDISRRLLAADPEFQSVGMLYTPEWNGFVEGPVWNSWWIQNSYGTSYCALPFFQEPLVTFERPGPVVQPHGRRT
ncbi:hypothetical protein LBMAG56_52930 [Verrucomicrobiota bacterium]|nr:hypothetical protein LBMAG56_52930 [Verrucomicrobiota bacterium]